MSIIAIGVDAGGPEDGGIGRIKVDLYKLFCEHCTSTYCDAIDAYSPVIRVDGRFAQFGDEAITRLRFSKVRRTITADIQIPEVIWRHKSKNKLRDYIADKVRESIIIFIERLKRDKHFVDEDALFKEINFAIEQYKKIDYE